MCPGGSVVESPPPSAGDRRHWLNPWVGKISWRRKWQTTPVFSLGKTHGQRSLTGYNPWGQKRVGHDLATKQQQQQHALSLWRFSEACACQHSTIQMKENRVLGPSHEGCLRGPAQVPTLHLNLPAFTGNASLARKPHTTNHSPPSLLQLTHFSLIRKSQPLSQSSPVSQVVSSKAL